MRKVASNADQVYRFVERTQRIMDNEQDERRREIYRRILQQTIERMEQRRNGGGSA